MSSSMATPDTAASTTTDSNSSGRHRAMHKD
jgi:hypothetical protein